MDIVDVLELIDGGCSALTVSSQSPDPIVVVSRSLANLTMMQMSKVTGSKRYDKEGQLDSAILIVRIF